MEKKKVKILAIDDNRDNLIVLKALIKDAFPGALYFDADSGRKGIESANTEKPDVILLDIVMPGMDGYEVCEKLKTDLRLRHIPVIMVTANRADKDSRVKALEAGADAFLPKPVDESELKAQIRAMLRIKESEDLKKEEKQRLENMVLDRTEALEIELADRKKAENKLILSLDKITKNRQAIMNLMQDLKAEMGERKAVEKNINEKIRELQFLNKLATDLSSLEPEENIGVFLLSRLKEFTGSELLIYSEYDADSKLFFTRHIDADKKILNKLIQASSNKILNNPAPLNITEESFSEIVNEVVTEKKSLNEASFGAIPNIIDKAFSKFTGIERYIGLSYVVSGEIYGTTLIGFKKTQINPSTELLKSFAHIIAVTMRRRKAEATLKISEEKFRVLIQNQGEGVGVVDLNEVFVFANPAAEEMFGVKTGQLLNRNLFDFIPEDQRKLVKHEFEKRAKQLKSTYEVEIVRPGGEKRIVLITATPQFNKDGNIEGTFGVFRDITDRKILEQKIAESEAYYRTLIDISPDGIIIADLEGNVSYGSIKAYDIFGVPAGEKVTGTSVLKWIAKDSQNSIMDRVTDIITGNNAPETREYKLRKFNGNEFWGEFSSSPLSDSDGNPNALLIVCRDISERKKAERTLHDIIDNNPMSIQILDLEGFTLKVNKAFIKLFGSVPPPNYSMLSDIQLKEKGFSELLERIKNFEVVQFPDMVFNPHDSIPELPDCLTWIKAVGFSLAGSNGKPEKIVLMHENITERKLAEDNLIKAKEKAEESDRLKTAFLHNISHEIRTPMNAIIGFSAMLGDTVDDPESQKSYIDTITQSSNHLLSIVTDIIEISNIEAGILKLYTKRCNFNEVLRDLHKQFLPVISAKGIELKLSTMLNDSNAFIRTDEAKFVQILSSLLSNALKFTSKGQIEFGYNRLGGIIEFYVKDTGIGIPEDQYSKVFDRFYQVENTISRQYEGTGLGLPISKAFVELLGGKIWLTSRLGAGTTFFFTLPFESENEQVRNGTESVRKVTTDTDRVKTILIAEDEDNNFRLMKVFLSVMNLNILHAENGREAVDICESDTVIDLVIMDIKMPVMDGYEATRRIKKIRPDLPVIAQTAFAFESDRAKALGAGCDDYISKPIRKDALIAFIKKYI